MKYNGLPSFAWIVYQNAFKKNALRYLHVDQKRIKFIMKKSKTDYRTIIEKLPEFEKNDRFGLNIILGAMFVALLLNLDNRPNLEDATKFYDESMKTTISKFVCKIKGKKKFTEKTIKELKEDSLLKCADRNEYSWNYDFILYDDGSGYEARFTKCGICKLMKEYGFYDLTPALCHSDYVINDMCGTSKFTRKYTLSSGGDYCDNGYKKMF